MSSKSVVCAIAILAVACGKSNQEQAAPQPVAEKQSPAEPVKPSMEAPAPTAAEAPHTDKPADAPKQAAVPSTAASDKPTLEVRIKSSGVTMKFDVTAIKAAPGQSVHLVLENQPPGQLPHNWALVKPGTEAAVAAAGLKEGPTKSYCASSPDILAHTEMVAPGKSAEITFIAPTELGKYPYICTFPGHYMMMKGVLEVAAD